MNSNEVSIVQLLHERTVTVERPFDRLARVAFMSGVILVLLAIDRLSKMWVQTNIEFGSSIPVIPDLVRFAHFVNRGAVSGLGQQSPLTAPLLAVAGAVFIPLILFVYRLYTRHQRKSFWIKVFLVTGLAAMISTVVDRFQYGYVVDFIWVRSLPIFNFADLLPPLGAVALIVELTTNRNLRFFGRRNDTGDLSD